MILTFCQGYTEMRKQKLQGQLSLVKYLVDFSEFDMVFGLLVRWTRFSFNRVRFTFKEDWDDFLNKQQQKQQLQTD